MLEKDVKQLTLEVSELIARNNELVDMSERNENLEKLQADTLATVNSLKSQLN